MWIILDLIIVAALVLFIINGYRKGLVKSCLGLVVTIASVIIAINLYVPVANFFRDTVVYKNLTETMRNTIEDHISDPENANMIAKLFEDAPKEFDKTLNSFGVNSKEMSKWITSAIDSGETLAIETICDHIVAPAAETISNAIAIILLFFVSMILLNLSIYILDIIVKLPVLNFANKIGGIIVGTVMGLLFSFVICTAVEEALPHMAGTGISITEETIDESLVFSAISKINPLSL